MATAVTAGAGPPAAPRGNRRPDPPDGRREPALGAERVRGERQQLGLRVAKRTIQRYLPHPRVPRPRGPAWATFLRHQAAESWAGDVRPISDLRFRPLDACFVIALVTRRVVQVGVTRHPTDAWVAQQLREATPCEQRPGFLIRDNDGTDGQQCAQAVATSGIRDRRTPVRAPRAKATCARFLGSVRRECLDHLLILGERYLACALRADVAYVNRDRPHQGLAQATPERHRHEVSPAEGPVRVTPILGGLHHAYRRAA